MKRVIDSGDFEKADYFTEIFVEIALANVDQITADGSIIIDILLALLGMEQTNCDLQIPFW